MKTQCNTTQNRIFRVRFTHDNPANGNITSKIFLLFLMMVMTPWVTPAAHAQGSGDYQIVLERGIGAGLDPDRLETLITRAQNRQVSPDDLNDMLNPAISLAENDLPYNPVLQKTMEGIAKRVPAGNIRQVLNQMANNLNRSAEIVDPWVAREEVRAMVEAGRGSRESDAATRGFRNQLLEHTSYALQQDMSEENIRSFLELLVSERVTERGGMSTVASALQVLPDLPTSRENPGMSNRILVRALNSGFSSGEIQQLPDAFRSAQFHSQLPADNIARGLDRQIGEGLPAEHIIQNLFQGNIGGGPSGILPPGLGGRDNDEDGDGDRGRGRGRPPVIPPEIDF